MKCMKDIIVLDNLHYFKQTEDQLDTNKKELSYKHSIYKNNKRILVLIKNLR